MCVCTVFTLSIFIPAVIFPMAQEISQGPLSGRSNRKLLQVQSIDFCSGFILLSTNHLRFTHVAVGYLEGPLQIPYNLAWKCWTPVIVGCHMCISTILCAKWLLISWEFIQSLTGLVFNPGKCHTTLLTRKPYWENSKYWVT